MAEAETDKDSQREGQPESQYRRVHYSLLDFPKRKLRLWSGESKYLFDLIVRIVIPCPLLRQRRPPQRSMRSHMAGDAFTSFVLRSNGRWYGLATTYGKQLTAIHCEPSQRAKQTQA